MFAVLLLFVVPDLRNNALVKWDIFSGRTTQQPALSYAKAVSVAGPAVVNIYTSSIQSNPTYGEIAPSNTRLGSGVIMSSSGYILTNFHVVQDANQITVLIQNGQQFAAELIGYDIYTDLAVLKVEAVNLPVIPQKTDLESYAGDIVLAIGNPLNLGQTVTQGIISATGRNGLSNTSYLEFLQMDAAINEGNSGGALINSNGDLVGINSRNFSTPQHNIQGIFFAIPYQLANKIMQKIISHGRVTRGWLGISATTYLNELKGFIIAQVTANSPAYKAGLLPGDVVYQIGEHQINSITQALDIVAETTPNTNMTFKIYRNKQQLNIPITIIEYNKLLVN